MKKALEVLLVVAALALGVFVVRTVLARRALDAHPFVGNPGSAPGSDSENPSAPSSTVRGGVLGLPMVKLSKPAKSTRVMGSGAVPPPVSAAP